MWWATIAKLIVAFALVIDNCDSGTSMGLRHLVDEREDQFHAESISDDSQVVL